MTEKSWQSLKSSIWNGMDRAENAANEEHYSGQLLLLLICTYSWGAKCERVNGLFIGHMCVNRVDSGSVADKCYRG